MPKMTVVPCVDALSGLRCSIDSAEAFWPRRAKVMLRFSALRKSLFSGAASVLLLGPSAHAEPPTLGAPKAITESPQLAQAHPPAPPSQPPPAAPPPSQPPPSQPPPAGTQAPQAPT